MRRFLAVLALVPAVAWGDYEDCNDRQWMTEAAMAVRDAVESGISEDDLLRWASEINPPGLQAAAYKAVEAYTYPWYRPESVSTVASVMEYACKRVYR